MELSEKVKKNIKLLGQERFKHIISIKVKKSLCVVLSL